MHLNFRNMSILANLAVVPLMSGCGSHTRASLSHLEGTPDEGDVVVSNMQNRFASAQVINDDRIVSPYLYQRLRCQSYDARSFNMPDHGSNSNEYAMVIQPRSGGTYNFRYQWGNAASLNLGAIDSNGLGANSASVRGGCAQAHAVEYFRREFDGNLISEVVQLDTCFAKPPRHTTLPITPIGKWVLSYVSCRIM